MAIVSADRELKIDIGALTGFLCLNLFIVLEQHLTHLCRMEFSTVSN